MKWTIYMGLVVLGLLVISCSGPQNTTHTPAQSILPPVVMSTANDMDTTGCRDRCATSNYGCMTSCTSGKEEVACAKAALRCMAGCNKGEVL